MKFFWIIIIKYIFNALDMETVVTNKTVVVKWFNDKLNQLPISMNNIGPLKY